jgi:hypothetical protein
LYCVARRHSNFFLRSRAGWRTAGNTAAIEGHNETMVKHETFPAGIQAARRFSFFAG